MRNKFRTRKRRRVSSSGVNYRLLLSIHPQNIIHEPVC